MLRMTLQRSFRVSNRAAIFAALALVFSSYAGFSNKQDFDQEYPNNPEVLVAQAGENANDNISKSRKMNLSLLLFGRN